MNLYMFGAKDFDVKKALYYMLKAASDGGVGRDGYVERPGIATYLEHRYAPQTEEFRGDHGIDGASITLEWSVDDFAISRLAHALGDKVIAAEFQNRAQYWRNVVNPLTGYATPRSADGIFLPWPGFSGPTSDLGQDGFEEGNAAQYTWMVPHNVAGLVTASGGREAVAERLDRFTAELNAGRTSRICGSATSRASRCRGCTTTSVNRGGRKRRSTECAGNCSGRRLRASRATTTSARCRAGMCGQRWACIRLRRGRGFSP
ncbi:glycosyl hydrolase 92 family protein [Mycobacterium xenopi 3993]|nr:glycosyl hydrolase 92 family protein [Mycobacterium xenopi 3993]